MMLAGLSDSVANLSATPTTCPQCHASARVNGGACLSCLLRAGAAPDDDNDIDNFDAVLAEVGSRDSDWRIGNYQILEEIGRGGMGVIYRARQRHSKRIVALKRVLSYHGDSRETLERFRREAEAAASLDHPNILPIYEVGEADGLPFFTMKYATGGTLQNAGLALHDKPRECVHLVAKVTRAVAYAHREGILHRDLKPANILLDGSGEPMVSDFGLAKWIDANSDLTRSLAIFGTPGYIAPEQASGDRNKLTPAADVYSVGAILFDLLANRPPFLGEHAIAVIRQAAEKPAPKLRTLNRSLSKDLETICAKCLEHDPRARYQSATELTEDLERYLEGRPIKARRVFFPTKTWRWARRNTKLAGSVAACLVLAATGIAGWTLSSRYESIVQENEITRHSVAITPIEDLDALSQDSDLVRKVTDRIENQLSKSNEIYLRRVPVSADESRSHAETTAWKSLSASSKVRFVISSTVRTRSGKVRFATHVIAPANGNIIATSLYDLDSLEQAGARIAPDLSRILNQGDNAPNQAIQTGGTNNSEARSYYERGKEFYFRFNIPDLERAITSTRESLKLDPDYASAHALLANACQLLAILEPDADWQKEAEYSAHKALELAPLLPDAHRAFAGTLQRRGKWKESIDSYLTAYELEEDARTAALIGNTYLHVGRPDLATRWLERAIQRETRPIYADNLGDALVALGKLDEAEKTYRTAIIFRPDLPAGSIGLSRIALIRGDVEKAREECNKARASYPKNPQPLMMAAAIELFARNFAEADKHYHEALGFGRSGGEDFLPAPIGFLSALGYIAQATEKIPNERNTYLREALQLDREKLSEAPENPFYLYDLAATEAVLHDTEAAGSDLNHALAAGWLDEYVLNHDPRFDFLRNTSVFQEVTARLRETTHQMLQGTTR